MHRTIVVLALALVACKKYESPARLDEACKVDRDCEEPLFCMEGFRAKPVCMKSCGPTKIQIGRNEAVDTSCPAGWQCSATVVSRLVDGAGNDQGSAFGGLTDRPICVPDGWTPAR